MSSTPSPFELPAAGPDLMAKYFRVLGDATRLRIVELLAEHGELSATGLATLLKVPQPKLSNHLACLRWCGFVVTRREHRAVHYRVADERVIALMALGRALLRDNAEHVTECQTVRKA